MIWIFIVVAAVGVFVVAAVTVGRETFRLGHQLPAAILDVDEAVQVVAGDLPVEVQARLSYDDVRILIVGQLEHLRERGVLGLPGEDPRLMSSNGGVSAGPGPADDVVLADEESVALLLGRVDAGDLEVTDDDVHAVIVSLHSYLSSIGAIGPTA